MTQMLLGILGFGVMLPTIIWGILNEEKLIAFEDRLFGRK